MMPFKQRVAAMTLAWLLLPLVAAWCGGVVTTPTEANLRDAMSGGGTVTFACDGTITLANTISNSLDAVFDASGHQVAISGNGSVRVFYVNSNVDLTLINLTVANGGYFTTGAGIFNAGGTVNLIGVAFATNTAWGTLSTWGGAIRNELGTLNLQNCNFSGNSANASLTNATAPGGNGFGGAIYNNGTMNASACTFFHNSAAGGGLPWSTTYGTRPQDGGNGAGGAVYNLGVAVLADCTFANNLAVGCSGTWMLVPFQGDGRQGGWGAGGAICNLGQLKVQTSSFLTNRVLGGAGGNGGSDYMMGKGYVGGAAGSARGGALYSTGTSSIASSAFVGNNANGESGGDGGAGYTVNPHGQPGGSGGAGGPSEGAAVFSSGSVDWANCTIAQNSAVAGNGGHGGPGSDGFWVSGYDGTGGDGGNGGAGGFACGFIASSGQLRATNCTFVLNSAQAGSGGSGGSAGKGGAGSPSGAPGNPGPNGTTLGGCSGGWLLLNTLLSSNAPANSSGAIADAGHNLSSDASCVFTNIGSLNNTDPKLGSLTDNGGPTLTLALLAGSPAIDAGDSAAAPPTDQRGVPRPFGAAADIGAYEYAALLSISRAPASGLDIVLRDGNPGQTCRLLTSTNFSDWTCMATNQVGTDGTFLFQQNCSPAEPRRFYKAVLP